MMYKDVVRDFAHRTLSNLESIEGLARSGESVFEATQLINSLLGLLVFPQQEFFDSIPKTTFEDLIQEGWPVPRVIGSFRQVEDLNQLLRYLRNAVAHFNLQFVGDGTDEIRLLQVWNNDRTGKQTIWRAELTLDDLRALTVRFIDLVFKG